MFIQKYTDYLTSEKLASPNTIKAYLGDITEFKEYLADTPLESASYQDARSYIMLLHEQNSSPTSINRKISSLKNFYKYLLRCQTIKTNPLQKIKSIKPPKRLANFVQKSEIDKLLKQANLNINLQEPQLNNSQIEEEYIVVRNFTMLLMLYFTGLRRAELASLKLENLNFSNLSIKVLGKGSKERLIPMSADLERVLIKYLKKREEFCCTTNQNSLFLGKPKAVKNGNFDPDLDIKPIEVNEIYRVIKQILHDSGVKARNSPHTLRHTFATHLMAGGAGIRQIQELLGHSSISSTEIYTHNIIDRLKQSYLEAHPRAKRIEKMED